MFFLLCNQTVLNKAANTLKAICKIQRKIKHLTKKVKDLTWFQPVKSNFVKYWKTTHLQSFDSSSEAIIPSVTVFSSAWGFLLFCSWRTLVRPDALEQLSSWIPLEEVFHLDWQVLVLKDKTRTLLKHTHTHTHTKKKSQRKTLFVLPF